MAGRIRREDVEAVRERARIEDIVGEQVALKTAGVGSMKGLCPFHDERTPSFHVRPQVGLYHCFGCGEGGDVIDFVQKVDGLPFAEAVEYLAGRVGVQLRYEEGGGPRPGLEPGTRQRLLEAHRVAAEFYTEQLLTPGAAAARDFLAGRGFDRSAADQFGIGYAPQGWDGLLRHLRGRGFTDKELVASGLMSQGNRGIYDRFRGRLVWPIREVTGDTVGFGARRLYDEDQGPKYLNTPETALYKKSHVLYGIDLAKREIARTKKVVVVEGYTDVMAMHLSGVGTAIATCGTAFGAEHARIVRRLMGDVGDKGAVVFTFDGDEAGQKAAMKAHEQQGVLGVPAYVAVADEGMDPCDLRQRKGPDAVRALVDSPPPLFRFVLRRQLADYDLSTVEGRAGALREAAPTVAGIPRPDLREGYTRELAGWLGMDLRTVQQAVRSAARSTQAGGGPGGRPGQQGSGPGGAGGPGSRPGGQGSRPGGYGPDSGPGDRGRAVEAATVGVAQMPMPDPRDPVATTERRALEVVLQLPELVPVEFDQLDAETFGAPAYRAVHTAVRAAGGAAQAKVLAGGHGAGAWVEAVREQAAAPVHSLITRLAVEPIPEDRPDKLPGYARGLVMALVELALTRHIADLRGRLQRLDPDAGPDAQRELFQQLLAAENQRRALRESA
ncbi:DNA primase [Cellulomonas denverensis]|uniref:DNA primase n=1 Tax=Cellulomonas denverensis TaxID=264297 RepID=A0A7X6KWV8_9CELL|nr:DNA primase [Cellulomonas denverensis]NKY23727.1 DNA primase [Cellulomonas denverensis]GIG25784.1 DNA primase [Cellulomonas denverensis]